MYFCRPSVRYCMPLLMVGTFGRTALFDGKQFYEADDSGADTLFIDRPKAQAYAANHGKVRTLDLTHRFLPFTR